MHPLAFKAFAGGNKLLYRLSGGRLGNTFAGRPILLLTVIGRKSGEPRTVPLVYMRDGRDFVVVGSKAGDPKDPIWWLNLQANPNATVEIGAQRFNVVASAADDGQRSRLWPRLCDAVPNFAEYQQKAGRVVPIVLLRPVDDALRVHEPSPNPLKARHVAIAAALAGVGFAAWMARSRR